jgi:hypothetical protein
VSIPPESQLAWFSAALEELPSFLPSSDVFRPLHHPPPRMVHDLSLGTLLLTIDSLAARADELTPAEGAAWDRARLRWGAEASSHAAAIEAKARAELPHRLNLWRSFLQDLEEKPSEAGTYVVEVRHRVMIERLTGSLEGRAGPEGMASLGPLDEKLRRRFVAGPFVWESALRRAYPEPRYWYLYGHPDAGALR